MDTTPNPTLTQRIFAAIKWGLLAFSAVEVLTLIIVLTGVFDYWWIRWIVGQFDQGLGSINFANPFIPRALISAAAAVFSFYYLRYAAFAPKRPRFLRKSLQFSTTLVFSVAALQNGLRALGNNGAYFDELGSSLLRYEITSENKPLFYSKREFSPHTGRPLQQVTTAVVSALDARRKGECVEVSDPAAKPWFAPGTGEALLWYSEQPDGWHFWTCPGFDPVTRQQAEEVTPEFSAKWHASNNLRRQQELEEKRKAEAVKQVEQEQRAASPTPTPAAPTPSSPTSVETPFAYRPPPATPTNAFTPAPPAPPTPPAPPAPHEVYYSARIRNRTRWTIPYRLWDPERGWFRFSVAPRHTENHVRKNSDIRLRYNEFPRPHAANIVEQAVYSLRTVDHRPMADEVERAPVSYFQLMPDGRVHLVTGR